jgi:hypothetical protein
MIRESDCARLEANYASEGSLIEIASQNLSSFFLIFLLRLGARNGSALATLVPQVGNKGNHRALLFFGVKWTIRAQRPSTSSL